MHIRLFSGVASALIMGLTSLTVSPSSGALTTKVVRVAAPSGYPQYPIIGETIALYGQLPTTISRVVMLETFDARRNVWVVDQQRKIPRSGRYGFPASLTEGDSLWRVRAPAVRDKGRRLRPALVGRVAQVGTIGQNGRMLSTEYLRDTGVIAAIFAPIRPGRAVSFTMTVDGVPRVAGTAEQDQMGVARLLLPDPPHGPVTLSATALPANGVAAFATSEVNVRIVPAD